MSKDFYKNILENIKDGVYFVDKERKITFWNKGAEAITGFKANEVTGCHCYNNILNHMDKDGIYLCKNGCPLHKTLEDGQERETVVYLDHKEGQRIKTHVHVVPIYEDEEIIGAVETFSTDEDKTQLIQHLDELKELAYYDQLTGLPNRRYLDNRLDHLIEENRVNKISFGVAIMDVDFFKKFNDNYGHDVGDEVLVMLAKVFKGALRGHDFIGRWGGEEFVAVIKDVNDENFYTALERIRLLVERSSLRQYDPPLKVTISIGATLAGDDDIDSIFKRADKLLYTSKENGRNRVTIG
ncbi:diguanylate cyclase [Acidaminobacter sp. JC074]|uniref:diguanylate cyclase n=1 Tax=Acidaminobacter sp. JC074 TaxID=2530199 RepID=UPI001F10A7C8|nr:diguanylate cyclase [Acidaminobacter sp. JC074]